MSSASNRRNKLLWKKKIKWKYSLKKFFNVFRATKPDPIYVAGENKSIFGNENLEDNYYSVNYSIQKNGPQDHYMRNECNDQGRDSNVDQNGNCFVASKCVSMQHDQLLKLGDDTLYLEPISTCFNSLLPSEPIVAYPTLKCNSHCQPGTSSVYPHGEISLLEHANVNSKGPQLFNEMVQVQDAITVESYADVLNGHAVALAAEDDIRSIISPSVKAFLMENNFMNPSPRSSFEVSIVEVRSSSSAQCSEAKRRSCTKSDSSSFLVCSSKEHVFGDPQELEDLVEPLYLAEMIDATPVIPEHQRDIMHKKLPKPLEFCDNSIPVPIMGDDLAKFVDNYEQNFYGCSGHIGITHDAPSFSSTDSRNSAPAGLMNQGNSTLELIETKVNENPFPPLIEANTPFNKQESQSTFNLQQCVRDIAPRNIEVTHSETLEIIKNLGCCTISNETLSKGSASDNIKQAICSGILAPLKQHRSFEVDPDFDTSSEIFEMDKDDFCSKSTEERTARTGIPQTLRMNIEHETAENEIRSDVVLIPSNHSKDSASPGKEIENFAESPKKYSLGMELIEPSHMIYSDHIQKCESSINTDTSNSDRLNMQNANPIGQTDNRSCKIASKGTSVESGIRETPDSAKSSAETLNLIFMGRNQISNFPQDSRFSCSRFIRRSGDPSDALGSIGYVKSIRQRFTCNDSTPVINGMHHLSN
jgi:hypothetical protein